MLTAALLEACLITPNLHLEIYNLVNWQLDRRTSPSQRLGQTPASYRRCRVDAEQRACHPGAILRALGRE